MVPQKEPFGLIYSTLLNEKAKLAYFSVCRRMTHKYNLNDDYTRTLWDDLHKQVVPNNRRRKLSFLEVLEFD